MGLLTSIGASGMVGLSKKAREFSKEMHDINKGWCL